MSSDFDNFMGTGQCAGIHLRDRNSTLALTARGPTLVIRI